MSQSVQRYSWHACEAMVWLVTLLRLVCCDAEEDSQHEQSGRTSHGVRGLGPSSWMMLAGAKVKIARPVLSGSFLQCSSSLQPNAEAYGVSAHSFRFVQCWLTHFVKATFL